MARITPRSSAASQTPFVPAMGSCAAVGRRWCTLLAVSLVLCLASPSWGQVEEMVRGVERATSLLGEKFLEIRRDVLGADTLAVSINERMLVCVRATVCVRARRTMNTHGLTVVAFSFSYT